VRFRGLAPLLAAVLAACGGSDGPQDGADASKERGAAAIDDQPKRGARAPGPGSYVGRTTQGQEARLQVFPGGRVHFLIDASLRCKDGREASVRSFPDSPPALRDDGSFVHREAGRTARLEYRSTTSGTLGRDLAAGAFSGTVRYPDGRGCRIRLTWSAARAQRGG
jgi:hypothetical protein